MGSRGPVMIVACAGALAAGLAIAWFDSRPTWDDTGSPGLLLPPAIALMGGLVGALVRRSRTRPEPRT